MTILIQYISTVIIVIRVYYIRYQSRMFCCWRRGYGFMRIALASSLGCKRSLLCYNFWRSKGAWEMTTCAENNSVHQSPMRQKKNQTDCENKAQSRHTKSDFDEVVQFSCWNSPADLGPGQKSKRFVLRGHSARYAMAGVYSNRGKGALPR